MLFARVIAVAVLAAGVLCPASAPAQSYPNRPVTLIVPFPPGGATDAIARIVQDSMTQSLGQQIVIENVGGAGGMIAAGRAARAAPDGYTVLLHQVALAVAKTLYPGLSFDAEKDFVAIGPVNTAASTIAARPGLPPTTLAELVRWLKEPGHRARIAHPGVGSFGHLCGVLFAQEIGAQVDQIPYRGAGPALNDLLAGHADLGCQSAAVAAPLVKTGKIKAYAIVGRTRFDGLPELPTLGEQGYRKLDVDFWHMLFAPAATPRPIIDRLNAALRHALSDPKVTETFARSGMQLYPASEWSPEAGAALLRDEIKLWAEVIRANHISTQ
ncbi:MAG TPA: tripartite tricarboxylate transporter substrate-binding protein [Xanthobacteraceae bacterium]|jgi:tripartite-type tricarboxylate transporter receptor subunit TctC